MSTVINMNNTPARAGIDRHPSGGEPHLQYFGFTRNPFPVVPDAETFFRPSRVDVLVTELLHAVRTRKGFAALTGEVGLGKTTISRRLIQELEDERTETALVFNTMMNGGELLQEIIRDFGIESPGDSFNMQLHVLNAFLIERYRQGINCVIILDDAQNLTRTGLELVRLISNLETGTHKLVQIVLVGQPELLEQLENHSLRQLRSRLAINLRLDPFSPDEVREYLRFRLAAAGDAGQIRIPAATYKRIHRLTGGYPRRIHILMDRCLYGMVATRTMTLSPQLVARVSNELGAAPTARPHRPTWWLTIAAALTAVAVGIGFTGWSVPDFIGESVAVLPQPPASTPADNPAPVKPASAAPLAEFLSHHRLQGYAPLLVQALQSGRVAALSDVIAETSGKRLVVFDEGIQLTDLPQQVFTWTTPEGRSKRLLFWNPDVWLDGFHYGYRAPAVGEVQRRLQAAGLYERPIDGVVGKYTMKALLAFQRRQGLPATGFPDAATQFLLQRADNRLTASNDGAQHS